MNKATMTRKVNELKKLKQQKGLLENRIALIENELKNEMILSEQYEYAGEDWNLSWRIVASNRFDQSAFKRDHPKLFEKYKSLTETRRFLIS